MVIIENKYKESSLIEECPYCHSTFYMNCSDYQYSSNSGELCGVGHGWAKYYDCPCCGKRVIVESKDWSDDNNLILPAWKVILLIAAILILAIMTGYLAN